jgi:ABC-type cobalamin/Fe3+-siderophores transport system ATPase subunit
MKNTRDNKIRKLHEREFEENIEGRKAKAQLQLRLNSNTNTSVLDEYLRALPVSQALIVFPLLRKQTASFEAATRPKKGNR